ncbi:MAG: hypothetical protein ACI9JL_000477 [Paracoccaceae bacterium]|jgi:hypothetical protein
MPFHDEQPELWHWTQAVAWIAFDDDDTEVGEISQITYLPRCSDSYGAAKNITRAIRQIVEQVANEIIHPVIWRNKPFESDKWKQRFESDGLRMFNRDLEDTRSALYDAVYSKSRMDFSYLHFRRSDVLALWPIKELNQFQNDQFAPADVPSNETAPKKLERDNPTDKEISAFTTNLIAELSASGGRLNRKVFREAYCEKFPGPQQSNADLAYADFVPDDAKPKAGRPKKSAIH